ncbi:hypothetical protein PBOI14_36450 [Pseudomonas sp. Boi14]|nr:hypothetical protein PBOI14_36450 [Pseudomonas sp. Boi14]
MDGIDGVRFAVWAPNARRVSVVGDFNIWDGRRHPMRLRHPSGVWELFIPRLQAGEAYKYEILGPQGILPLKADPMALATQLPPDTASRVAPPLTIDWQDQEWMLARGERQRVDAPLSIYELHAGSWQCEVDDLGEVARQYSWAELAERLIPYVKDLGFTHIELMPIMEHPFGGSWGYQPLSQFAPSARYGSPQDFAAFVDACHQAGIGVILDWVPAHFPTDTHGLAQFDGTALYEYGNPLEGFHQDWDTLIYNLGVPKCTVSCWLRRCTGSSISTSTACGWMPWPRCSTATIRARPGNGCRTATAAGKTSKPLIFCATSTTSWPWRPGRPGDRRGVHRLPGVSQRTDQGGLGFAYKWNMGWMHDSLHYIQQDPVYRAHHHNELSFGLVYAWSERFILPISHDEVVHGKHSLIDKMPGDRWQKFANLRAYLSFMWPIRARSCCSWAASSANGASGTTTSSWTGTCCSTPSTEGCSNWWGTSTACIASTRRCTTRTTCPRVSNG